MPADIVQHADLQRDAAETSSSSFRLPEGVRRIGAAVSAALSVPPWYVDGDWKTKFGYVEIMMGPKPLSRDMCHTWSQAAGTTRLPGS